LYLKYEKRLNYLLYLKYLKNRKYRMFLRCVIGLKNLQHL
jgi:hypothetical protein